MRRKTRVLTIGKVKIGGDNPIVVQSMTNTKTENVEATVKHTNRTYVRLRCKFNKITADNSYQVTLENCARLVVVNGVAVLFLCASGGQVSQGP